MRPSGRADGYGVAVQAASTQIPFVTAAELHRAVDWPTAIEAIAHGALRSREVSQRSIVDVSQGQLLLMPAEDSEFVGCKVLSVAPANPAAGLERIQGIFLLMDAATLTLRAMFDGVALTSLRTPAVSAAAIDRVAESDARTLGIIGTGPQAIAHALAVRTVRPIQTVLIAGTSSARSEAAADTLRAEGVDAVPASAEKAAGAEIVVCATTASDPVLEHRWVSPTATVAAIGSHEAQKRELPGELLGAAQVIVESRGVALSEAGDVIQAIAEGHLSADALVELGSVMSGEWRVDATRPRVVKTCGVGWQDLAIASVAHRALA